jgi:hypothetical protein
MTWQSVGTHTFMPTDQAVEVGSFDLAAGQDTIWVRITQLTTPAEWPFSYGILSWRNAHGIPLGSIKAYSNSLGEVFRLGNGLPPSDGTGSIWFEPRGFNLGWLKAGFPWELQFEAQAGASDLTSGYWNRDPSSGVITPKTSGDNLDMTPGWIKAKNLIITDDSGGADDRSVPGYQSGTWAPDPSDGTIDTVIPDRNRWSRVGKTVFLYGYIQDMSSRDNALITIYGAPYEALDVASGSAASSSIKTPAGGVVISYIQSAAPGDPPRIRFLSTSDAATGKWESAKYNFIDNVSNSMYFAVSYQTPDTSWKPLAGTVD